MENEEWRIIPILPDYAISSLGRIKRITKPKKGHRIGQILNPTLRNGYFSAMLVPYRKRFDIHRLVALAFLGACPINHQCNHLNGNKLDNRASNLEWVTPSENLKHAFRIGISKPRWQKSSRKGSMNPNAKLTLEQVTIILNTPNEHGAFQKLATQFNVSPSTIHSIRTGHRWGHVQQTGQVAKRSRLLDNLA